MTNPNLGSDTFFRYVQGACSNKHGRTFVPDRNVLGECMRCETCHGRFAKGQGAQEHDLTLCMRTLRENIRNSERLCSCLECGAFRYTACYHDREAQQCGLETNNPYTRSLYAENHD